MSGRRTKFRIRITRSTTGRWLSFYLVAAVCLLLPLAHAGMKRDIPLSPEWKEATGVDTFTIEFDEITGFKITAGEHNKLPFSKNYSHDAPLLLLGFYERKIYLFSAMASTNPTLDVTPLKLWEVQSALPAHYENSIMAVFRSSGDFFYFSHIFSDPKQEPEDTSTLRINIESLILDDIPLLKHIRNVMDQESTRRADLLQQGNSTGIDSVDEDDEEDITPIVEWQELFNTRYPLYISNTQVETPPASQTNYIALIKGKSLDIKILNSKTESANNRDSLLKEAREKSLKVFKIIKEHETLLEQLSSPSAVDYIDVKIEYLPPEGITALTQKLKQVLTIEEIGTQLTSLNSYPKRLEKYSQGINQKKEEIKARLAVEKAERKKQDDARKAEERVNHPSSPPADRPVSLQDNQIGSLPSPDLTSSHIDPGKTGDPGIENQNGLSRTIPDIQASALSSSPSASGSLPSGDLSGAEDDNELEKNPCQASLMGDRENTDSLPPSDVQFQRIKTIPTFNEPLLKVPEIQPTTPKEQYAATLNYQKLAARINRTYNAEYEHERTEAREKQLLSENNTPLQLPDVPRLDLMIHPTKKGRLGIIEAKNCGAESIVYGSLYVQNETNRMQYRMVKQMIRDRKAGRLDRQRLLNYLEDPIKHPHIVEIVDWYASDDVDYILTVERAAKPVEVKAPWPEQKSYLFARQMLSALAALHSKLYVHRDFKPGNVLYQGPTPSSPTTTYILTDLGTLRKVDNTQMMSLAGTTAFLTPKYLEILLSGPNHLGVNHELNGFAHDLFSYAITLIYLNQGKHPLIAIKEQAYGNPNWALVNYHQSLSALQEQALTSTDILTFGSHLETFLTPLMGDNYQPTPPWMLSLIQEILTNIHLAGASTANTLYARHFSANPTLPSLPSIMKSSTPNQLATITYGASGSAVPPPMPALVPGSVKPVFHSPSLNTAETGTKAPPDPLYIPCEFCGTSFDCSTEEQVNRFSTHQQRCRLQHQFVRQHQYSPQRSPFLMNNSASAHRKH